jgi:hypothetical protein
MRFNKNKFVADLGDGFIDRPLFLRAFCYAVEFDDDDGSVSNLGNWLFMPMGKNRLFYANTRADPDGFFAYFDSAEEFVNTGFTGFLPEATAFGDRLFGSLKYMRDTKPPEGALKAFDRARSKMKTKHKEFIANRGSHIDLFRIVVEAVAPALGAEVFDIKEFSEGGILFMFAEYLDTKGSEGIWFSRMSYGSCSVCDSVISALSYSTKDKQLAALRSLCLHIVQDLRELR